MAVGGDRTECARRARDLPCAQDRELRRRRTRQQIARGDCVVEGLRGDPPAPLHPQPPEQRDVSRWSTESGAADPSPCTSTTRSATRSTSTASPRGSVNVTTDRRRENAETARQSDHFPAASNTRAISQTMTRPGTESGFWAAEAPSPANSCNDARRAPRPYRDASPGSQTGWVECALFDDGVGALSDSAALRDESVWAPRQVDRQPRLWGDDRLRRSR